MKSLIVTLALVTSCLATPPAENTTYSAPTGQDSAASQPIILHDGFHWALVPGGAVIHIPSDLKSRVGAKPVGELLSWQDFLAKNSRWLTATEVAFEEAAGFQVVTRERLREWSKQDKVIVAIHHGDPTAVRVTAEQNELTLR